MHPELKTLIDDAANLCGGHGALARRIGLHQPDIPGMLSGRRCLSPETVAALCEVLQLPGDEARRLAALAVIENPKNAGKAEVLRRVFFGCLVLGGVALGPQSADARTGHQCTTMYRRSTRQGLQQPAFRTRVGGVRSVRARPQGMAWQGGTFGQSALRMRA